jgi:hypothetical protein
LFSFTLEGSPLDDPAAAHRSRKTRDCAATVRANDRLHLRRLLLAVERPPGAAKRQNLRA